MRMSLAPAWGRRTCKTLLYSRRGFASVFVCSLFDRQSLTTANVFRPPREARRATPRHFGFGQMFPLLPWARERTNGQEHCCAERGRGVAGCTLLLVVRNRFSPLTLSPHSTHSIFGKGGACSYRMGKDAGSGYALGVTSTCGKFKLKVTISMPNYHGRARQEQQR